MCQMLDYRAAAGWEHCEMAVFQGTAAIAHAREPLQDGTQVVADEEGCLGYAGVVFEASLPLAGMQTHDAAPRLLSALRNGGTVVAEALAGAFVLAWSDGDTFNLLRDATGVKVLYWARAGRRLVFASESKALFADPMLSKRLRPAGLAEYFTFSFIPGERTMLEGVYELQPGHLLTFRNGEVRVRRWFLFEEQEWQEGDDADRAHHVARLRRTFADSTRDCLDVAGRMPGVFLSGGIDSSAVLAMVAEQRPGEPIPTFSVHFGAEYPNENEFIEQMVLRYRTEHHVLELRPRHFDKRLEEICWHLDDPIGDPVAMPNYLMAEYAARHVPVVLNGEGGDPCFGGPKNIPMLLSELYGAPTGMDEMDWLGRQYLHSFQRAYADLVLLLGPAVRGALDEDALIGVPRAFLRAERPRHLLNRLMAMNIRLKGANLILVKVDKMTSANRLLALPPLFSRSIVEESMRIPVHLKLEGVVEKSVLKHAVADLVPRPIIDRPKSGMRVPVYYWFQGELRRFAKRHLSLRKLRRSGLFDADYVHRIIKYDGVDVRGRRHGLKLWMLITFLLWYEQFFGEG